MQHAHLLHAAPIWFGCDRCDTSFAWVVEERMSQAPCSIGLAPCQITMVEGKSLSLRAVMPPKGPWKREGAQARRKRRCIFTHILGSRQPSETEREEDDKKAANHVRLTTVLPVVGRLIHSASAIRGMRAGTNNVKQPPGCVERLEGLWRG